MRFAAWTLRHGVDRAYASLTVEEGLYGAYTRYLRTLEHLEGVPFDLQSAIDELLADLRAGFGVDAITGEKTKPPTLLHRDAVSLLARLEAIVARAEGDASRR